MGDNLYLETPASVRPRTVILPPTASAICSKAILSGECQAVNEISDLIAAQRAYEMNVKVITAADQMLSTTSTLCAEDSP